jgi:hypothetical protein
VRVAGRVALPCARARRRVMMGTAARVAGRVALPCAVRRRVVMCRPRVASGAVIRCVRQAASWALTVLRVMAMTLPALAMRARGRGRRASVGALGALRRAPTRRVRVVSPMAAARPAPAALPLMAARGRPRRGVRCGWRLGGRPFLLLMAAVRSPLGATRAELRRPARPRRGVTMCRASVRPIEA